MLFISLRFLDILDILLVAFLLYQLYMLIRGTVAINIFVGIFSVYLLWLIVRALDMQLLGNILSQFIGVGVIALIIVFQQEIRRFLLMIGTRYFLSKSFSFEKLFSYNLKSTSETNLKSVITACKKMSRTRTGALLVFSTKSELRTYAESGEAINADISTALLESIFFKHNPLHDGAVIIVGNKIRAARCVLPVSEDTNLPGHLGMRHRAALGMSEVTDSIVVVVSEETGHISLAFEGKIQINISTEEVKDVLREKLNK